MNTIGCEEERLFRPKPAAAGSARTIYLGLIFAAGLISGCSRSATLSNVSDVCDQVDGSFVEVEGFLQLPNFLEARIDPETEVTMYELFLAAEPDGRGPTIKTQVSSTRGNKTNRIAELPPDGYTQRDLRIFTASGETVGASNRLRVSGELSKEDYKRERPCILKSEKIENFD